MISIVQREEGNRATIRAREALKAGDRLLVRRCAGTRYTVTFAGWNSESWMSSKSGIDDIHALHVEKVNGVPTTFRDTIEVGHRTLRRFIRYPERVCDGTPRCIRCGQIDEEEWHDDELCRDSVREAE